MNNLPPANANLARTTCNAEAIHSFEAEAWQHTKEVDIGCLGACALCPDKTKSCLLPASCSHNQSRFQCTHCGALLFQYEARKTPDRGTYNTCYRGIHCCENGSTSLPPIKRCVPIDALWSNSETEPLMKRHARRLNNHFALASSVIKEATAQPGDSTWKPSVIIQGKVHYHIGSLTAADNSLPKFAQLYVHDPASIDAAASTRIEHLSLPYSTSASEKQKLERIVAKLLSALRDANPYIQDIMAAAEVTLPWRT